MISPLYLKFLRSFLVYQAKLEEKEAQEATRPLKEVFREQLLLRLNEGTDITQKPEDDEADSTSEKSTFQKLAFWKK